MSLMLILHLVGYRRIVAAKILSILLLVSLFFTTQTATPVSATGTIRYVKPGGIVSGTCNSWAHACYLQYALATVAVSGDQLWVEKGTYKPTIGTGRTYSFLLRNGIRIYGGFAGTETKLTQRNPKTHVTILSGDIGVAGDASDNSYHVVTAIGVTSTAVLDGFTITGGKANGSPYYNYGGGMYVNLASPTLTNLTFINNTASYGGGMVVNLGGPTLTNVTFQTNSATGGGGMYNSTNSTPVLKDVTFSGNSATALGGGIFNDSSSPKLTNVTFYGNKALGGSGGGMFNNYSSPTLTNATFSGNSAAFGGGMYNTNSSSPVIHNSIFWSDGSEIYNFLSTSTPTISDSIVKGGCPASASCDNVFTFDPVLGPLANNGGFTKTMALLAGSGAIDGGGAITPCASTDQRGVKRPQGGGCDMGAYEVKEMNFPSVATYDGWVLESAKGSNIGGSVDSTSATFRVGDDSSNRRYRGFLSFNTASLPDGAAVVQSVLEIKVASVVGRPFSTQGVLQAGLVKPYFGSSLNLVNSDWQSVATVNGTGSFQHDSSSYNELLNSAARAHINKTGQTQFRLRFSSDAYNNSADYLSLYSGNATTASYRPRLIVYYNP